MISQYPNLPVKSNVIRLRRHISSGVRRARGNSEDADDEGNQSVHGRYESIGQDETRSEMPRVDVTMVLLLQSVVKLRLQRQHLQRLVPFLSTPVENRENALPPQRVTAR